MSEFMKIDVRQLRARLLANFGRYAAHVLTEKSGLKSMLLCCSQYYADEAADAVHDTLTVSRQLLPIKEVKSPTDSDARWKLMQWDSNGDAVFAFSAHCSEEGASAYAEPLDFDETDMDSWEGASPSESPLALAQLIDGEVRVTWIGFPHRPWLDFARALSNRDESFEETPPQFVDDPAPAALVGDEPRLHAQVLEDPSSQAARQVLCDLWAQRGDPRGEFGALCFSGKRDPKVLAQVARLVLEHGRSWMGPLVKVIPLSGALFGEGPFLEKAVVHFPDAKTFKALGDDPHWATVKSITFVGEHGGLAPAMQHVLEVGPLNGSQLAPLKKGSWHVRRLEVVADKPPVIKELAALTLPLERLSLRGSVELPLKPLLKAKWLPQLRELELWLPSTTLDVASGLAAALVALEELAPEEMVLRAGTLSPGGRTGWALQRNAEGKRSLVLVHPDERLANGPALAKALKVKLDDRWEPTDDWLHFGLGSHAKLT
ncbi:MAG: hypothetical protein Q8N23_00200 [Archangium sp.]|nr:hypothetical protein [Archangium sp.]MDP3571737.1 hypothetical protein [Archangium sp.]